MRDRPVRALVVLAAIGVASLVACGLSVTATGGADDSADALAPTPTSSAAGDGGDLDAGPQQGCNGGTTCDGGCTDLTTDPQNCNACGNACPSGDTCENSACSVLCINATQKCGAACVDLSTDLMNCGTCGHTCTGTDVCSAGTCQLTCATGLTTCTPATTPKYCADTTSDHNNCGTCGHMCGATEACSNSVCKSLCATTTAVLEVGDIYGGTTTTPPNMVGCVGRVNWKDRDSLCASGTTACTPEQWVARYGGVAPRYNYWTDAVMGYSGRGNADCTAIENGGNSCATYSGGGWFGGPVVKQDNPMRVCASNRDSAGNGCYWDACTLDSSKTPQYFGGCAGDTTAGTLCCSP